MEKRVLNRERERGTHYKLFWRFEKLHFCFCSVPFNLVFLGYLLHDLQFEFTSGGSNRELVNELENTNTLELIQINRDMF